MLAKLQEGLDDFVVYAMPDVDPVIVKVIHQCWSSQPLSRPTIDEISKTLTTAFPRSKNSFTENLIRRLQQYNVELESVVGARTKALRDEMDKVDDLLRNLLPV